MPDEKLQIQLSALQHYNYFPRQCALIHQEQSFDENLFTLRGRRVTNESMAGRRQQKTGFA